MAQVPAADQDVTGATSPTSGVDALTRAIRAHVDVAAGLIKDEPDLLLGFHIATELAEVMRELSDQAAALRADQVYRLREQRKLTLAALGDIIGLSLSRADQLYRSSPTLQERQRAASGFDEGRD